MALQADADFQILLLGFFDVRQHFADAGGIGGDGLFHEDVLAGFDGGFKMNRTETRRRGQNHQIYVAVDQLLIGVEPDEFVVIIDGHPVFVPAFDGVQAVVQLVFKGIGHRN